MSTIVGYGSKHNHEFTLNVNETSTDIINNTSTISFDFTIYKSSYSWSGWNSITYTVNIDGTNYTGTIPSYTAGNRMVIASGTQTISHNSDGTKNIGFSFNVTDNSGQSYTCGNASASGTMDLTTIARASTINSVSGSDIESNFVVTYTSYYNQFTNKLRVSIPNVYALQTHEYTSGTSFTLDQSSLEYLYTYMANKQTVPLGFVIETWNGSTKIGESAEIVQTCSISNCEPTIETHTYIDTNADIVAITENNQKIVKNKSTLRINLTNLNSYKGATLSSCIVTINNVSYQFPDISGTSIASTYLDIGTLDISNNTTATIVLTDSRGNNVEKTLSITIVDYILLSIGATISRTQPTTGEVGIRFSGNYFNGNVIVSDSSIANTLSINWYYRERYASTWTSGGSLTPVISNNTYSNGQSVISLGSIFDYQKAYEFKLEVKDKYTTLEPTYLVMQGIPVFNWGENFFNVNKTLQLGGENLLSLIFPIGSTYITQTDTNPNTILGFGTWARFNGKVAVGLDANDSNFNSIGKTGGSTTHTLTIDEMPSHTHTQALGGDITTTDIVSGDGVIGKANTSETGAKGGGQAFSILQPYQVVGYMWIRTN